MTNPQPRSSREEHTRRGTQRYEQDVRPYVEGEHHGQIVAFDVDTGVFEVADDTLTASQRLLSRYPDAQVWCVRIGYPAVYRFGSHFHHVPRCMNGPSVARFADGWLLGEPGASATGGELTSQQHP